MSIVILLVLEGHVTVKGISTQPTHVAATFLVHLRLYVVNFVMYM